MSRPFPVAEQQPQLEDNKPLGPWPRAPERVLLTIAAFARLCSVSRPVVRRLIASGKIRALRHPDIEALRIASTEVSKFLSQWEPTGGKPIRPQRFPREKKSG